MPLLEYFKELYKFRELLIALTVREIKVRYKQTLLGASWAVIQPLSLMVLFTVVFSFFLKVDSQNIPYPIFSYSALLAWTFFSTSLSFGSLSVVNNSNLVSKVYFPKETLPLASVGSAFLDLIVGSVIFIAMMLFYGIYPGQNILYLIPVVLILVLFTCAAALFSACLVVLWRDIKFVIPLILQILLFLVPAIYPVSRVPDRFQLIYLLNPMAAIIDGFRSAAIGGSDMNFKGLAVAAFISIVFFVISYIFFKENEKVFADII